MDKSKKDKGSTEQNIQYPQWICHECAEKLKCKCRSTIMTMILGVCGWCNESSSVAHPRNYGWPPEPKNQNIQKNS